MYLSFNHILINVIKCLILFSLSLFPINEIHRMIGVQIQIQITQIKMNGKYLYFENYLP